MKKLVVAALLFGVLATSAFARNFAVPDKDPVVTLTIPDTWKMEEITYGYSAQSPGKDVFFSVEYADSKNVAAMMDNNEKWMKENEIKLVKPNKAEAPLNGIPATIFQFETQDANGPTTVDFIMLPGGKDRMILLTVWGNDEERKKHGAAIDQIMSSVKPIQ